jgi:hypothetical protein
VRAVVLVPFDQFGLRLPEQVQGLLGVSAELDPLVCLLRRLDMPNPLLSGAERIPEIRVSDVVGKSGSCDQQLQRTEKENPLHDSPRDMTDG